MKPYHVKPVVAACLLGLATMSQAGTFVDNFTTSHSFKSNGVAGTHWTGVSAGISDPSTVSTWDANISAPGTLTLTNRGGAWRNVGDGPFLWTMVKGTGDFTNVVHVSDMSQANYNMSGLIVRDPSTASQNYVMLALFAEFNIACIYRDTINGSDSDVAYTPPYHVEGDKSTWANWLRITRESGVISLSASTNNIDWEAFYTSARTDLTNDLQVGIMNSTYSANTCWAQYQNFSVEGPGVVNPTPPGPASGLVITPQPASLNVSWTSGAASAGSVVVVRKTNPVTRQPLDGVAYAGNATYGSGDDLGEENYVAYVGSGNNVVITNVIPTLPYTVAVYSYSGSGASTLYAISNAPYATGVPSGTPTHIVVSLESTNAVAVDDTIQAHVDLWFDVGVSIDVTETSTYGSSVPGFAPIDSAGLASGLAAGVTTISATNSGFVAMTNLTVVKVPVTDDFSVTRNYLTDGVAGTIWSGVRLDTNDVNINIGEVASGPTETLVADAGITTGGRLTVSSHDGAYGVGQSSGFFLYRTVSGDFDISVQVPSLDNPAYHMPGLMVRLPTELLFSEQFYGLVAFNEFGLGNGYRWAISGANGEAWFNGDPAQPFMRIQRETNTFHFYIKEHALDAWTLVATEDHPEWDGVVMQVGLVDQTFTGNTATTEFDNLIFTTPSGVSNSVNAPSAPSGLELSVTGANQIGVSWTPGAGSSGSVVIAHPLMGVTRQPVDGNDFTGLANADFTLGQDLGASNMVVYAGAGGSVNVTNLPLVNCSFAVYSYKTVNGTNYYNQLSPVAGNIDVLGAPVITADPPAAITRYEGQNISITAGASSGGYWEKGGAPVADGGRISGALTKTLTISDLVSGDSGSYVFMATNAFGSAASSPAVLTVLVPSLASETSVLSYNPSAFWRLNETSGTTAFDYVGGNDGTHGASDILGVPGPLPADGFAHFEGGNLAAQFPGNVGATALAIPALTAGGETVSGWTVTAWIKPSVIPTDRAGIVVMGNSGLRLYGSGNGLSILWENSIVTHTGIVPPLNQWSFIAMVLSPSGASVYMATNGGWQTFSDSVVRGAIPLASGYVGSDRAIAGRYFEGAMDEVSIYKTALSPSAVANLFNGVVAPPEVTMSIESTPGGIQVSWPQGTLLESTNLLGPWTTNAASSPLLIPSPTGNKFFRVLVQ